MKKRFSEEQIIGFLHEAEAGMALKGLYWCLRTFINDHSFVACRILSHGFVVNEKLYFKYCQYN